MTSSETHLSPNLLKNIFVKFERLFFCQSQQSEREDNFSSILIIYLEEGMDGPQLSYLWNGINWRSYLVGGIRAWGFSGFWTPLILPCKAEITIIKNVLLTPVRLFLKLHRGERDGSCLNWFTSKDLAPFKMCGRILPFLVFQEGSRFQITRNNGPSGLRCSFRHRGVILRRY